MLNILANIRHDLLLHVFYGLLIYTVINPYDSLLALVAVAVAAIGKEVYDKVSKRGTPSVMDFVATVFFPSVIYVTELSKLD